MSYTTMLSINLEKGTCEEIKEYSNSYGSALVIWEIFCEKYLNQSEFYWLHNNGEELWELYRRTDIPKHQRAVLMMTFDRAVIIKSNFTRASDDIKKFLQDFPVNPEYENHWPRIADDISKLIDDPNVTVIGFHHTSVSENPFTHWDNETETEILQDDIYDLYSELDSL